MCVYYQATVSGLHKYFFNELKGILSDFKKIMPEQARNFGKENI
ncbi:MAG: hypothetical protein K0Q95_1039 [Bacteroidota bacterium]|jgi:hypothetical protein|nr:hypothetical protein [Bacteroidota bacterium]